ncbi:MAG: AAA-like domain-containing protein [Byssovorax sp.]
MPYPTILDPALDELRQAYQGGDLVLFVGAGVSAAAGLPSWARLVKDLAARARARGATAAVLDEIDAFAKSGRFIDALTAAKTAVGAGDFGAVVEGALDDRNVLEVPEIGQAIGALGEGLRAVLTTNIDHLLERALGSRWRALQHATPDMARRRQIIFKLHGTLLDRKSWVFTRDEYDRAMYADPLLKDVFSAIFLTCPILFVGYGLADDDFDQVLGRVRALAGGQAPRHFALVADESISPHWRKTREDAGVRVIGYPNPDHRHTEVPRILRWLAEPEVASPGPPGVDAGVMAFRTGSPVLAQALPPSPDAPYDGSFYIHRGDEEARALAKLATPGTPIVISGPWLSGKSTLLAYLLEKIREQQTANDKASIVINADLENLLPEPATADGLLESFGRHLLAETGAEDAVFERLARGRQGWSDKLVELMEKHVLPACEGRLVLVIQNADAVWGLGKVQGAFYRALRVWKERAYLQAWSSLRFILLLSTTPSLVFEDPEHANSPFANLTTDVIELGDLAPAQLVELARMHGLDWSQEAIDRHVFPLVGGHPHLNRALMYRARMLGGGLEALVGDSTALEALFSTHLAALGGLMKKDGALQEALVAILDNPRASLDEDHYQRLRRAGLVAPTRDGEHRIRYRLYESYLRRRWKRPGC